MVLLTVGEKNYKLKLNARDCVELEKKLSRSPLSVFMNIENNELPTLDTILTILKFCIKDEINNIYDLYDEYIENGGTYVDLIKVLLDVLKECGLIPKELNSKN